MSIEIAKELFTNGNLNQALKVIEADSKSKSAEEEIEGILIKSQILYHKGDSKGALKNLERIEEIDKDGFHDGQIQDFKAFLHVSVGKFHKAEAILESSKQDSFYNLMTRGMLYETEGNYAASVECFEDALTHSDYDLDRALVHYKLAHIFQLRGLFEIAIQHLKTNLDLILQSDLIQNRAVILTLIGQNQLLSNHFDEGVEVLLQAISEWENLNSPFGLAWAIGEIAVLYILNNSPTTGLNYLIRLYEIIKSKSNAFNLSTHLLNIIAFSNDLNLSEVSNKYLEEFTELVKSEEDNSGAIMTRFIYGQSLVKKKSKRLTDVLSVLSQFEGLNSYQEYFIKLQSFIHQCEILLLEIQVTEDQIVKDNLITDLDERNKVLLNYLQTNQNIGIELHASIFRLSFAKLKRNPEQVFSLISELKDFKTDQNSQFYTLLLKDIEEEYTDLTWKPPNLDKDIHSIPKLKILSFLLPRISVTFSDLQRGTELSSGNLTGQCQKLEEIGFIERSKIFDQDKLVTIFCITPLGFQQFRQYAQQVIQYLNQIL